MPPPVLSGDVIRVVAPSGPFDPRLVWRGLGWLSERYRVRYDRGIFSRHGYLAGNDARRRDELASALHEPGVAAIWCARGGVGANRYAHTIDFSTLRDEPRWLVGFSDITALHIEAAAVKVMSLHAAHVTALGRGDAVTREQVTAQLADPAAPVSIEGLPVLVPGLARGRLVGGNLALVHACAVAGRLRWPGGAILFIEDIGERPYRIDRMLTTLLAGGHLDALGGLVLGEFTACGPGLDGVSVEAVVRELFADRGIPVVAGLPSGHGRQNQPLVLGANATVRAKAGEGTLAWGNSNGTGVR